MVILNILNKEADKGRARAGKPSQAPPHSGFLSFIEDCKKKGKKEIGWEICRKTNLHLSIKKKAKKKFFSVHVEGKEKSGLRARRTLKLLSVNGL